MHTDYEFSMRISRLYNMIILWGVLGYRTTSIPKDQTAVAKHPTEIRQNLVRARAIAYLYVRLKRTAYLTYNLRSGVARTNRYRQGGANERTTTIQQYSTCCWQTDNVLTHKRLWAGPQELSSDTCRPHTQYSYTS